MIKLYAVPQGETVAKQLDILADENINISFSVDDIKAAGAKNSSYSKNFKLPATKNNNKFFEHLNDVNRYTVNFNPNLTLSAFLEIDGAIIIDGFLEVLSVDKKGDEYYYNIVIYDASANLFELLGDDTVADLDIEGIKHSKYRFNFNVATGLPDNNVNYDNMLFSWDYANGIYTDNMAAAPQTITTGVRTTDVFYPLVYNDMLSDDLFDFASLSAYHSQNYPLTIRLKKLLDTIFSHVDYNVNSTFFNSDDFKDIYFLPPILQQYLADSNLENVTATGISNVGTTIGSTNNTAYTIKCDTEVSDVDNEYNLTTGVFTAATDYNLYVNFKGVIKVISSVGAQNQISLVATISGDLIIPNGTYVIQTQYLASFANYPRYVGMNFAGHINLSAGATATFKLRAEGNNQDLEIAEQQPDNGVQLASPYGFLNIARFDIQTPSDRLGNLCRDIKLVDIVKDCFKMFNLVTEPTDAARTLVIEPYSTFIDLGGSLDWSNKVDLKDAIITPIKSVKEVNFKFADDADDYFLNKYNQENGSKYGELKVLVNSDASSSVNVELDVFAAAYTGITENLEELPIGSILHVGTEDNDTIKNFANKPRLFYRNSVASALPSTMSLFDSELTVWNGANEIITQDTFSSGSVYNANPFTENVNTNTLAFNVINDYTTELGTPVNTLYNRFYFDYINDRFNNKDSFLYTVKINLTARDIKEFSFGSKIIIKGQEYRVNKIEYNTMKSKLSKVELFRI